MGEPWRIIQGDLRRGVLKQFESDSFDGLLSDPPYGYSFMGKRWDYSVPSAAVWGEVERVLKPGAYAVIFGGPRTYHRMACAVEDGGLEIVDCLMWLHGQGFPKNYNVSRALDESAGKKRPVIGIETRMNEPSGIVNAGRGLNARTKVEREITTSVSKLAKAYDGYGSALKPAFEPAILARKMLDGTYDENVMKWRTGALAIDASRIGAAGGPAGRDYAKTGLFGMGGKATIEKLDTGRWPSNVILSHADECEENACVEDCPVRMLDEQSDEGGASRFFYTAKVNRTERDGGCEALEGQPQGVGALRDGKRAGGTDRSAGGAQHTEGVKLARNHHPTVKPIDLCRYLARLILPPKADRPRRILVPFSGSGSEMIACMQAGWDEVVGVEREAEYVEIAQARIRNGGVLSTLNRERERRERPQGGRSSIRKNVDHAKASRK